MWISGFIYALVFMFMLACANQFLGFHFQLFNVFVTAWLSFAVGWDIGRS